MKWTSILLVAVWLVGRGMAAAQDEPLSWQLEHVGGVRADAAEAFLLELRRAVGQSNHAEACALIAYPLRHGDGAIADAAACEAQYDAIFTVPVRRAIGKQQFDDLFVNQSGAMLGQGEVWFAGRCGSAPCQSRADLRVTTVNSDPAGLVPPKGKVLLGCVASGQRLRVSADGNGGASLGVWYAPRITGAPEREFPRAEPPGPPSACGSRTWTFSDGTRTYVISDLPCDAYLSPPPMGSVGRVSLTTPTSSDAEPLWCRESTPAR